MSCAASSAAPSRHGYKLGVRAAFFHKLVPDLVADMGAAYPELLTQRTHIMALLKQKKNAFCHHRQRHGNSGNRIVGHALAQRSVFNGETAFKLHDTYGFPLDLTADICRERNVTVDAIAFDAAMQRQKEQARAAGKFTMATQVDYTGAATDFQGYAALETQSAVLALYKDGVAVSKWPKASWALWCWTARRSTPNPAARQATVASCAAAGRFSASKTQNPGGCIWSPWHRHDGFIKSFEPVSGRR